MSKKKKNQEQKIDTEKVQVAEDTCEQETCCKEEESSDSTTETVELSPEEQLQKECDEYKDKYMRLAAEFDNFRKRTLKEKADIIKSGGEHILSNMLPVIDDFDRAMDAANTAQDIDSLKEGLELITNKFKKFLTQNGVQEIDAKEKDFDTDLHEAITKIPAPHEDLKGKVVDVIEKGYMIHDKVIRFAKVVIGE